MLHSILYFRVEFHLSTDIFFLLLSLFPSEKSCKAKTLNGIHVELWELFGLGEADGNTGYYGISGILEWATQNTYEYGGRAMCRGMDCDKFDVCIKNKLGNTALISYYWSCEWR